MEVNPGALVISLDFEIHWGVLERDPQGPYAAHLRGVPASVRGTLDCFRDYGVRATWAVVGMLFARDRAERLRFSPAERARYGPALPDPYAVATGEGEADDPLHYAPTLIGEIGATPGQELATHTFAHVYGLEPADNLRQAFHADLAAARAIMRHTSGSEPRSIVFPRNQHNPALDAALLAEGVLCYRGNGRSWMWQARGRQGQTPLVRAARLADAYLGENHLTPWSQVAQPSGLFDVPASFLLRPRSDGLKRHRIARALAAAARRGQILHLWWHPHNFGVETQRNLGVLRRLLDTFGTLREREGMESLGMADVALRCGARFGTPATP